MARDALRGEDGPAFKQPQGATLGDINNFQARYIIRHPPATRASRCGCATEDGHAGALGLVALAWLMPGGGADSRRACAAAGARRRREGAQAGCARREALALAGAPIFTMLESMRALMFVTLLLACNASRSDRTDAPAPDETEDFRVEEVVTGLDRPWALEFLPDGRLLMTERPGRLRIVTVDGALSEPLANVPEVMAEEQGGLLDVALAHDFATSSRIYLSYAEPREGGSGTSVAAATLRLEGTPRLEDVQVIFRQLPTFKNGKHFGSRIAVTSAGPLFVGLGERFTDETREKAQTLDNHLGKVVRIHGDGSVPADNPFVGQEGALPEIWSIGHRNIQSAALHPDTGKLWIVEHGPKGGDEVNLPEAGKNYGWPRVSYGVNYDGSPVGSGDASAPGIVEPIYYWVPSIAPSGLLFYTGDAFPAWRGDMFVGALVEEHLARLVVEDGRVIAEERLLTDLGRRIRDVAQGPDGLVYVLTDGKDAKLLRLAPNGE